MKGLSLLSIVLLLLQFTTLAQAPDTMWTKTFGGNGDYRGYSVKQTTDGGYIVVGNKRTPPRHIHLLLIKTDANGDTLWTKYFGGTGNWGESVQQTTDGGYIITGYTAESYGAEGTWLLKTDANGDTLWIKTFIGNGGNSVQQTTDLGYVIAGRVRAVSSGDDDVCLIKTTENGDSLWLKTFGGFGDDCGFSIQQTSVGGFIIVGYTDSFGAGGKDIWLIKTDENGDTLWTRTYGGSSDEEGFSVWQTTDSGYVIVGYTNSFGSGNDDVWIIKTDGNGDTVWTKTLGGIENDVGKSVQQTADGGYIVVGYTSSFGAGMEDVWLIKLEPDSPSVIKSYADLLPSNYSISHNYPNPFNPTTTIKYQIPEVGFVTIKVYDVLGSEIMTLVNEEKSIGSYGVEFNATTLPSGIYFYRLQSGDFVETKKMVFMK